MQGFYTSQGLGFECFGIEGGRDEYTLGFGYPRKYTSTPRNRGSDA